MNDSTQTPTNAITYMTIALVSPLSRPVRTVPSSGTLMPISTCPRNSATTPIAASGATYPV